MKQFIQSILVAAIFLANPASSQTNSIAEAQKMLTDLGYIPGPSDGRLRGALDDALKLFYKDRGSLRPYTGNGSVFKFENPTKIVIQDLKQALSGKNSLAEA